MKFKTLPFQNEWLDCIGEPELSGSWLIWGGSSSGKTHFCLKLAKYLSQFAKVVYNAREIGIGLPLKKALVECGMRTLNDKKLSFVNETMEQLTHRLSQKRGPQIAIIDSLQYTTLNYRDYIQFKEAFPRKILIFISHSDGRLPSTRTAKSIRFDADVKIHVEGFKAFPMSRYGGGKPFVIWEEGAREYWADFNEINKN